ncbi:hypothetical protein GS41_07715 [Candidatus Pseudothioglobus singularis]|jgi:8-oxo-dGTP diphosphatase|uniref:Nudix family hydrolase n=1 Tax=Candidatus Pseudothioglobus singularis TaxID=1427364 RepID=UPI00080610F6|nr:Nudix family hydrolase [Candidatus Pseudothioglobus singularis]ANQ67092.1 hypothetical protein GS41_07715 [Candidatus Pseudothioglobus singularis]MDA7441476.1 Nudix family hydrolase [Candidatus Pseudothioglobus singularis]|tara:strand:+ start:669 stop:1598 length:930 start_codon:yes stop_codon:yes gene_type:complete
MSHKNKSIEVVVGVMRNDNNEIFITRRQIDQFMSGYWELPGGKVENKESHSIAIMRELYEETGVTVKNHHLIQTIEHQYPQKTINLSVFSIEKYDGAPLGNEGQEFCWCGIDKLKDYKLLPTMWKIIHRICLPKSYWITPDEHESDLVINQCKQRLRDGIKIIQLRSKSTLNNTYIEKIFTLCQLNQAKLILNTPNKSFKEACDGWHLTSNELMEIKERPFDEKKLFGASVHNLNEAKHAEDISADYISLSPINETLSHPNTGVLGWENASDIINQCKTPIFLLGGMNKKLMDRALSIGAQGIAGIRGL